MTASRSHVRHTGSDRSGCRARDRRRSDHRTQPRRRLGRRRQRPAGWRAGRVQHVAAETVAQRESVAEPRGGTRRLKLTQEHRYEARCRRVVPGRACAARSRTDTPIRLDAEMSWRARAIPNHPNSERTEQCRLNPIAEDAVNQTSGVCCRRRRHQQSASKASYSKQRWGIARMPKTKAESC